MGREYPYTDLRDYLAELDRRELLTRVPTAVDKDSQLVPLVRLQFRGLPEAHRRAFFFEEVTDGRGRSFDATVAIATFAANRAVYAAALGVDALDEVGAVWQQALSTPIEPVEVDSGPCKEVVITDPAEIDALGGVDAFPHPVSTPGFDPAPFLTAGCWISKDPEDGTYNSGVYRGMIKGPRRVGLQMDTPSQHIAIQLRTAKTLGVKLEAAIVVGAAPVSRSRACRRSRTASTSSGSPADLMGRPLEVVRCETVDLEVPATAELVIEGVIDPNALEQEGPFGEASGFMGPRTISPWLEVTGDHPPQAADRPGVHQRVSPERVDVDAQDRLRERLSPLPARVMQSLFGAGRLLLRDGHLQHDVRDPHARPEPRSGVAGPLRGGGL